MEEKTDIARIPSAESSMDTASDLGEKRHTLADSEKSDPQREFEPIACPTSRPAALHLTNSRRSSRSIRSYGGHDGYTCYKDVDIEAPQPAAEKSNEKDAFVVHWEEGNDALNPRNFNLFKKWVIVLVICMGSVCVTYTSSVYTSTYGQILDEFHVSREVATLGLSLFVAGLGIGPMVLGPLSEFYGRRPIYIVSYFFFVVWLIPCAVAKNTATMLVSRFINGLVGSAFLSVAGGTVGDMFTKNELSLPMMVYSASPFLGPELGPLVGGYINQYISWRWSYYTLIIWAGVELLGLILLVPETYHPVLLRVKAQKMRKETGDDRWRAPIEIMDKSIMHTVLWSCIRPFQLLFFDPMCLCLCVLTSIILGILYLFFGAIPLIFRTNHGFSLSQCGLSFLGLLVGMLLGTASDPLWHKNYTRLVQQREAQGGEPGGSEPEFRLPPTIAGAVVVPIALFGFGWTTFSSVHWIVPIIFSCLFGIGIVWVFSGVFTFLVDCYPLYAASSLAANSFARSSFAAAFPLFGIQMYETLGYQWATSLLAFLALAMAPFPYLFFRYGKQLRAKSRFASA